MNFGSSTYTGGRQPPLTSYVKSFYGGSDTSLWTFTTYTDPSGGRQQVLTPSNNKSSVYIVKDLIVGGSINNPSDAKLKKNVEDLPLNLSDKLSTVVVLKHSFSNFCLSSLVQGDLK